MGQIRWTEKASSHLHAIYEYIAQDSKVYASRFTKSLIKATSKLEYLYRNLKMAAFVKLYMKAIELFTE